jgi:hypothetical protein
MSIPVEVSRIQLGSHQRTVELLRQALAFAQLPIEEVECTEKLEVYCEVCLGNSVRLSIAKGWGDPGFRIFTDVTIPGTVTNRSLTFSMISNHCATQGLVLTQDEEIVDSWMLETVIYSSGFNPECFCEMIETMRECVVSLKRLSHSLLLCRVIEFSPA